MVNDVIRKYYLLCSKSMGGRRHNINDVPDIKKIYSTQEIEMYYRKQDNFWVSAENVIGGDPTPADQVADRNADWEAILIY